MKLTPGDVSEAVYLVNGSLVAKSTVHDRNRSPTHLQLVITLCKLIQFNYIYHPGFNWKKLGMEHMGQIT